MLSGEVAQPGEEISEGWPVSAVDVHRNASDSETRLAGVFSVLAGLFTGHRPAYNFTTTSCVWVEGTTVEAYISSSKVSARPDRQRRMAFPLLLRRTVPP